MEGGDRGEIYGQIEGQGDREWRRWITIERKKS